MKPGQGADQLGFVRWILAVAHWGFQWHSGRVLSRESRHSLSTRRVSLQGQRGVRRQNLEQKRKPWPEPARDVCAHGADRIERYRLVQCAASRGSSSPDGSAGWAPIHTSASGSVRAGRPSKAAITVFEPQAYGRTALRMSCITASRPAGFQCRRNASALPRVAHHRRPRYFPRRNASRNTSQSMVAGHHAFPRE